jgi:hypothetical protein
MSEFNIMLEEINIHQLQNNLELFSTYNKEQIS